LASPAQAGWNSSRNVTTRRIGDEAGYEAVEQVQARRVDPVGVFDHDQDRGPFAQFADLIEQHRKGRLAFLLGAQGQGRIALRGQPQQLGDERCVSRQVLRGRFEQGLQLVELRRRGNARRKVGRLLELGNDGEERAQGMMRRAEVAKTRVRFALQSAHQAFGEPRLADAGLAGEQDDTSFAGLGLPPTAQQQIDLLLPAGEGRQVMPASRIEPADARILAEHPPCLQRLGGLLHHDRSERAAIEQPSRQPVSAARDDDLARRRAGLQPHGHVRGFADGESRQFPLVVRSVADDDETARDADAGPKGRAHG
jgi:hypothetical protein